jgi:hypothetical protein
MLSFARAQGVLLSPGEHVTALRELVGELLRHEQAVRYVVDRLLGLDVRYAMGGAGPAHPLVGGSAPDLPLRSGGGHTRLATLMHGARPVLLDLTADGRLRAAAAGWTGQVQTEVARTGEPLDGVLVRPDGYVAWAAAAGTTTQTDSAARCGNGSARRAERPPARTEPAPRQADQPDGIASRPGSPAMRSKGGITDRPGGPGRGRTEGAAGQRPAARWLVRRGPASVQAPGLPIAGTARRAGRTERARGASP